MIAVKRLTNMLLKRSEEKKTFPTDKMSLAIKEWSALYENTFSDEKTDKSLNLAAVICSELARLCTIEFSSEIVGNKRAEYINEQYQRVVKRARVFLEYACAKGAVVLKPYVDKDMINVSVIQADSFYPTAVSATGQIMGGIFYETIKRNGYIYKRVEEHLLKDTTYTIKNSAYKSKFSDTSGQRIPLDEVEEWKNLESICVIKNMTRPLFSYLCMPYANTIDPDSCLGVSAFSKATQLIKDAYCLYKNLLWEFESGKRALYIDECAIREDDDKNYEIPEKRLYKTLSTGNDELFHDWSPVIRQEDYIKGLERILRSIEFNCGLSYGTLSEISVTDKTAEEIKASKQRSYATVCDIQNSLKRALEEVIEIMDIYCDIYDLCPRGKYGVSFNFDDSIICDRNKEFQEKIMLLEKGIIAPWEMRVWYNNEDDETAKSRIGEINEKRLCNSMA